LQFYYSMVNFNFLNLNLVRNPSGAGKTTYHLLNLIKVPVFTV